MKPSELAATLPLLLKTGRTPFIWGDPGIGKSDLVRQAAATMGLQLIDIRLSLYDPTDLRGFPTVRGTGKSEAMHFVPPAMLPTKGKGIMLLDELPAAPPAVQAVAYQLVLDRRLGEYAVPEGWLIIAAGNFARNGGVHYTLPPALANRFVHIELQPDATDWDYWATQRKITDMTRAFIRFRPALLSDMEARKGGMAFPSPRSWAFADDIIKMQLGTATTLELLKGTVGEGAATEYLGFVRVAADLPTASEILISPDTAPVPSSPAAKYAVTTLLESKAETKNFKACMTYIRRMDLEFQTAFVANITRNKRELASTQEYIDWCMANKAALGVA